jgi:hypothetical protein
MYPVAVVLQYTKNTNNINDMHDKISGVIELLTENLPVGAEKNYETIRISGVRN